MNAAEIAAQLGAKKTATGWAGLCPAHDDHNASLSISEGDNGRTLFHCHAGCSFEQITAAAGVTAKDLAPTTPSAAPEKPRMVKAYDYTDADGKLLYQVCRFEPKDFRQRQPDGQGGWVWNMTGVERVLYKFPEVVAAVKDGTVIFVTEGCKDADALAEFGLVATCNSGGAGKWRDEYTATLTGAAQVVVIADKDTPGRAHAAAVARSLDGKVKVLKVVELPDLNGHAVKDAADFIGAGGTMTALLKITSDAPQWTPHAEISVTVPIGEFAPPWKSVSVADVRNAISGTKLETLVGAMEGLTDPPLPLEITLPKALALAGCALSQPVRPLPVADDLRRGIELSKFRICPSHRKLRLI